MVGDDEAFQKNITSYPWIIPIEWQKDGSSYYLLGNLISNDVIMTVQLAGFPLRDYAGKLKLRIDKDNIKTGADIEKIKAAWGVVLIFLKEKLDFSKTSVRPICLPNKIEILDMRKKARAKKIYLMKTMGYEDITSINFEGADPVKMKALKMRIRQYRFCRSRFPVPRFSPRNDGCAQGLISAERNKKPYKKRPGICKGDLGAPVMELNRGSWIKRRKEKRLSYKIMGMFNQYAQKKNLNDLDNCGNDPARFVVFHEMVRRFVQKELKDSLVCRRPIEDYQVGVNDSLA